MFFRQIYSSIPPIGSSLEVWAEIGYTEDCRCEAVILDGIIAALFFPYCLDETSNLRFPCLHIVDSLEASSPYYQEIVKRYSRPGLQIERRTVNELDYSRERLQTNRFKEDRPAKAREFYKQTTKGGSHEIQ